jgi:hypothetical protein
VLLPTAEAARLFGVTKVSESQAEMWELDRYVGERGLPPPDLLKLDVQGAELQILQGGTRTLGHAKAIIAEVSFVELYEGQSSFSDLCAFLQAHGFTLHALGASTPRARALVQADALFMRHD